MYSTTSRGNHYELKKSTNPGYYVVYAERDGRTVQLGTVLRVADDDWEFIAMGVYFDSGKNLIGRRSTRQEAAEMVVESTMAK